MENPFHPAAAEPGLKLIETILWDGQKAPLWPYHQARILASAQKLGWNAPANLVLPQPDQPSRLRLTANHSGACLWEVFPLPAAKTLWRAALAGPRYRSEDPWLLVKSTRRALQDQVRAQMPPALDELIFVNEKDQICEGTISNIFFDKGQGLRTPPLSCGLLPGVLRASLGCPEEVLSLSQVKNVRLWAGNALRGLIRIELRL